MAAGGSAEGADGGADGKGESGGPVAAEIAEEVVTAAPAEELEALEAALAEATRAAESEVGDVEGGGKTHPLVPLRAQLAARCGVARWKARRARALRVARFKPRLALLLPQAMGAAE